MIRILLNIIGNIHNKLDYINNIYTKYFIIRSTSVADEDIEAMNKVHKIILYYFIPEL
jgi:hypothetical protein